jgi:hypothetical protein
LNFKGTSSQEEHKTIFSGLKINTVRWLCLVNVTLRRSFQQSTILSVTLTLIFHSLSFLESQFSQSLQRKAAIDEIPVSHLTGTEKCWKVNLIRQSHLTNL